MPQLKIDRIVSFSSEDSAHPANNLLYSDPAKKWKCQNVGEKSLTVVFQLEKACNISKIDIGNEHSAYIEVLVSRSTSPEDYRVLLLMSSFMSPLEARQSQNINKVRMFTKSDMSEPERNEKWDRIKIVCTQPFNRHVQYGLSFINFYTNEFTNSDDKSDTQKPSEILSFGKFSVRPESPDIFMPGDLFSKRKELSQEIPTLLKGTAAIREATSLAQISSPLAKKIKQSLGTPRRNENGSSNSLKTSDKNDSPKPRNRNELLYSQDEEEENEKIDKHIEKKSKEKLNEKLKKEEEEKVKKERTEKIRKEKELEKNSRDKEEVKTPHKAREKNKVKTDEKGKGDKKKFDTSSTKNKDDSHMKDKPKTPLKPNKRKPDASSGEKTKPKKAKISKPFDKLLENVVLVISGIQNPERASLRSMALSMGAKYKPDWDDRCTHLICAFANTPKFNQVKGKGKIVRKTWIDDCYSERKRLPWRRYALDKADLGSESEEDIFEKEDTPPPTPSTRRDRMADSGSDTDTDAHLRDEGSDTEERVRKIQEKLSMKVGTESNNDKDNVSVLDTNTTKNIGRKDTNGNNQEKIDSSSSGNLSNNNENFESSGRGGTTDIYDVETDSEHDDDINKIKDLRFIENNFLHDFFADKLFYIDNVFDKELCRQLRRYIVAYKGLIVDELDTSVEIMVTTNDNSSFLKDLFPSAVCVSPDWIWECHNSQKYVSMDGYIFN